MTGPTTKNDGRHSRGVKTQEAILVACRQAMQAGCWRPPAYVIAALARRSVRSVYQHFPELLTLYKAALDHEGTRLRIGADLDELSHYQQVYALVSGHHPDWPDSTTAQLAQERRKK